MPGLEVTMRRFVGLAGALAAALSVGAARPQQAAPGAEPRTLRVEYVHSGNAAGESFALARVALEGPWPGPSDRRVDDSNLGKYLFEVRELATNRLWYSRGFASVYGEWESTEDARRTRRAFAESLRFPVPAGPV